MSETHTDDLSVENEIERKGLNKAPRVTLDAVHSAIVGSTTTVLPNGRTTIVQLTLDNGFTVEGSSAAVSAENFDKELGERLARQRAVDEVWRLLGFRLADRIMAVKAAGSAAEQGGVKYRDAATGYYVTKQYALDNPETTVQERG